MVNGFDTFRKHFEQYSADYVLIGGVACELALNSRRFEFRPTEDFDIVIVSANVTGEFGAALKNFIHTGGYTPKRRESNGEPTFFCFKDPQNGDFPSKLELATDKPITDWPWNFAPLDAGDAKSSLSAILFESNFYNFILDNAIIIKGVSTIRFEGLIPLKCLAWLELTKKEKKTQLDIEKIEKHRHDIFMLADAIPEGTFTLPNDIAAVVSDALQKISVSNNMTSDQREVLSAIYAFYQLAQ